MGFPSVLISIFHLMPCGNDGMAAHSDLDETMCKRTLCPHPQCWVSFRRIEQGNPRYRPPGSVTTLPSQDAAGGLPFLSVTTLPSCQTPPNDNELHQFHVSSLLTFSAESAPRECTLYSSAATCSMDKVLFPGMNSLRGMRGPSRSPESYASSHRKTAQVDVVDPYFKDGRSRHMTMIWVPNAQQKPQTKDSEKPPKVQIKYLTLADMPGGEKGKTWNPALPAHRKKKPPTGGCPHNLTLVSSSPPVPAHTKTWMSGSSVKDHPEVMTKNRRRLYDHFPDMGSQAYPALDNTLLENWRVVLHDTRARRQHSPAVPHTGGPVYRLDEQFAALDNMEMNLDSIRNQYYLWKKYIDMTRPSRRIKPPDDRADKRQRYHKLRAPGQLGCIGLFPYHLDSALSYHKHQAPETPEGVTGRPPRAVSPGLCFSFAPVRLSKKIPRVLQCPMWIQRKGFICANNFAMKGKRKTLNVTDVLAAVEEMECQRFLTPLKESLEAYRRDQKGKKEATELRKKHKDKKTDGDDPDRSREEEVEEEEEKMDEDEAAEEEEVEN
ncbi:uncharacterized protein LOC134948304 isoform X3 [Pseudophryne corroboree]|uniref:uncharacterized protein LOC134948304 isoform X3 n=1 Tax=Pseudophryne corroboree TaxID=495146 RepID=UPI003081BCDD